MELDHRGPLPSLANVDYLAFSEDTDPVIPIEMSSVQLLTLITSHLVKIQLRLERFKCSAVCEVLTG